MRHADMEHTWQISAMGSKLGIELLKNMFYFPNLL